MPYRIARETQEYGSTVLQEDEEKLQQIYNEVKNALEEKNVTIRDIEQNIVVDMDNCDLLKGVGYSNIMCRVGGGLDCNALTIRLAYEIIVYNTSHLLILKDLADSIKNNIEKERDIPEEAKKCFLVEGDGFADDYGEEKVFNQSPQELKKMIEKGKKDALERFEKLDLDGNEQADYAEHHQQPKWKQLLKTK
jgi:hypothetical protein